jgi:hypothetical protein
MQCSVHCWFDVCWWLLCSVFSHSCEVAFELAGHKMLDWCTALCSFLLGPIVRALFQDLLILEDEDSTFL